MLYLIKTKHEASGKNYFKSGCGDSNGDTYKHTNYYCLVGASHMETLYLHSGTECTGKSNK